MHWPGIQLEFNPFSPTSRFERAKRAGRIGDALRVCARHGKGELLLRTLEEELPDWPIRTRLAAAVAAVLDLRRAIGAPPPGGGAQTRARGELLGQADAAIDHLVEACGRVSAAGRVRVWSGHSLAQETAVNDLLARIPSHVGLVRWELNRGPVGDPGGSREIERDLIALAEMARTVRDSVSGKAP